MALYSVAITKNAPWQSRRESFANVYTYDVSSLVLLEQGWRDLIDAIVEAERPVHSTEVQFESARVWGPVDQGPALSETVLITDLTGTGNISAEPAMYHECAYMVSWRCERSPVTGRPIYLRKWIHSCAQLSGAQLETSGAVPISSGSRSALETYAAAVESITIGPDTVHLAAPSGRRPIEPGRAYDYLEHHQFHVGT